MSDTSYMFRCLLRHLQGDHYVICPNTIGFCRVVTQVVLQNVLPEDGVTTPKHVAGNWR